MTGFAAIRIARGMLTSVGWLVLGAIDAAGGLEGDLLGLALASTTSLTQLLQSYFLE